MSEGASATSSRRLPVQFSLTGLLTMLLVVALASAYGVTAVRLRTAEAELRRLREETGYLPPTAADEIAAARLISDQPMTYRLRVRVPASPPYRIAYSSLWPESAAAPRWFGAVAVPPGESVVTVRILKDPRDDRWKITTLRRGADGTRRMATVLPENHVEIFRRSHDWLTAGVTRQSSTRPVGQSLRLLDERVLVGEGAMMLYGDGPPSGEMVGVFAELQPDIGAI
ncbi:hypothetical protein Enr13x_18370 [Stieleria neptunia]|uniref:Uncharacterized protein n=1 Tax=Stieleria neptunia TaxID=2527979 RepID=A0A518HMB0_9BACT|nr:hypothetical protein [Stieleria neptunia]QDV41994.1 hypothetical protein Enr13x_18370 [Stieleria neptunia]